MARVRDTKAEYKRRLELGERRGLSRRQARGHPGRGEPSAQALLEAPRWPATFIVDGPPRLLTVEGTMRDAVLAGRYAAAVRLLAKDKIDPDEFQARTQKIGRIAGLPVVTDPDVALAVAAAAGPDEWRSIREAADESLLPVLLRRTRPSAPFDGPRRRWSVP